MILLKRIALVFTGLAAALSMMALPAMASTTSASHQAVPAAIADHGPGGHDDHGNHWGDHGDHWGHHDHWGDHYRCHWGWHWGHHYRSCYWGWDWQ